MTDLKPCPFCGMDDDPSYKALIVRLEWHANSDDSYAWVHCRQCDAYGPCLSSFEVRPGPVDDAAIAAWNRRAEITTEDDYNAADVAILGGDPTP